MITDASLKPESLAFVRDVREGLSKPQRELPSKYLYDDIGSALFDVITLLPEYGLTRADERLLQQYSLEIARRLPESLMVAELGSGTGRKTRCVLEALSRRRSIDYYAIDISSSALQNCKHALGDIDSTRIFGIEQSYVEGLWEAGSRRKPGESLLVLFLGSTIGNFYRDVAAEFLTTIRRCLLPGDALLLGTDLEKPAGQLLAAYDDSIGVTAAFNLNVLARINRELDADFVLSNFKHEARYDEGERRIEMHLCSTVHQFITIRAADFAFSMQPGETIWTEASQKFRLDEVRSMAEAAGFVYDAAWVDREWPFAESLLIVDR
jgi:L-histidine N-alpha-methyltransferase